MEQQEETRRQLIETAKILLPPTQTAEQRNTQLRRLMIEVGSVECAKTVLGVAAEASRQDRSFLFQLVEDFVDVSPLSEGVELFHFFVEKEEVLSGLKSTGGPGLVLLRAVNKLLYRIPKERGWNTERGRLHLIVSRVFSFGEKSAANLRGTKAVYTEKEAAGTWEEMMRIVYSQDISKEMWFDINRKTERLLLGCGELVDRHLFCLLCFYSSFSHEQTECDDETRREIHLLIEKIVERIGRGKGTCEALVEGEKVFCEWKESGCYEPL
ncbi:MAG: uncharacterized protein A8A55_2200 [Amphiamblys sp. WSBS2006]|nr:MAG: uncharacterized protein A8A55_2200 [Amphiamblys sp. WSBS2006]